MSVPDHCFVFSEPQSYKDFIDDPQHAGQPGVYVLGFRFSQPDDSLGLFLPYYVGRHRTDVRGRIITHMRGFEKGTHLIYKNDRLRQLQSWQDELGGHAHDEHLAYANGRVINGELGRQKTKMSLDFLLDLVEHVKLYRESLYITCAHVSNEQYPDVKARNEVVDWLEQKVKSMIGKERVMGRIGSNLLRDGNGYGELQVPESLSYAFQKDKPEGTEA